MGVKAFQLINSKKSLQADENHEIKAVVCCHNETATGVTSDIAAVGKMLKQIKHPAMLMVDCVSSVASIDFRMDQWGVDVAVSGSQKGFMLPAGMAILAFSPRALAARSTFKSKMCAMLSWIYKITFEHQ